MVNFATGLFHLNERKRGYKSALKTNNIPFAKRWLKELGQATFRAEMAKAIRGLVEGQQAVDAIVFASNALALHGLKQLNALSVKVPDDVAVLSFDEVEAYDLFYTPVTCIRQPLLEMGQLATQILVETIQKNNRITQINLDGELLIRASTQPRKVVPIGI